MSTTRWGAELTLPVSGDRDHIQGREDAAVTLVEYGDYECPYCGAAYPILKQVQARMGERLRFVFRNFPISTSHPHAEQAAEAAEAAGAQGRFWEMHDLLLANQDALEPRHLVGYAEQLGLDVDRFRDELRRRVHAPRVAEDVADADASQVTGTPTFFINGLRHYGAYDMATLEAAIRAARQRRLAARA
jgi:protein-disulfide isomerase